MNKQSADELEQASELEMKARDFGLAQVRAALRAEYHPDFDGKSCVICGDELAPVRIAYKKVRCATCQEEKERREKRLGVR